MTTLGVSEFVLNEIKDCLQISTFTEIKATEIQTGQNGTQILFSFDRHSADDTANFLSSNNVAIDQKAINNCSLPACKRKTGK